MKHLIILLSIFLISAGTINKHYNYHESKVIFFSGTKCGPNCHTSEDVNKQCEWFSLGEGEKTFADLNTLTSTYKVKGDCKWVGGRENGTYECEYYDREMKWGNRIRSVYIGDPDLVVILWDRPNFEGLSIRVSGTGCTDLTKSSWGDRARSARIYFR
jgi:hypothetical protein